VRTHDTFHGGSADLLEVFGTANRPSRLVLADEGRFWWLPRLDSNQQPSDAAPSAVKV
jgi:hypothetical protein